MQPNQNMPEVGQPVRPVKPVSPASLVSPAKPVEPVEPVGGPTFDNGPSVVEGKGGKKTGWILGLMILAIIAAGGVGFGVWAMMDGNSQKDALNAQISSLKQQNSTLQEQLSANGGGTIINIDTDNDVNSTDYIYVGEWGLKIKIPTQLLGQVGYLFGDSLSIIDSGASWTYGQAVDWDTNDVLTIFRSEEGIIDYENCQQSCTTYITTINGYDYSYSMQGNNLEALQSTALKEMANKDSFSAI